MPGPYILAIDQGTTSSRALVVDRDGLVVGSGQVPFEQQYPQPGWVEHDPEQIWSSVQEAIGLALGAAAIAPGDLQAIGITNQRETVLAWERASGRAVHNAIVWQDRRTAAACDELRAAGHEAAIQAATGLTIDPYFSATKLRWLLEEVPGLRGRAEAGEAAAGTVDSWLVWKLTGGTRHITDYTNASRTLLFNIRRGRWDEGMLELFAVPRSMLPVAAPSRAQFATTSAAVFGAEVPILAVAGDQQAALYGQGCFEIGQAKNTYGTGCFLLLNTGPTPVPSRHGLLTTLGFGAVGWVDDWRKVVHRNPKGLSAKAKIFWQSLIAIVAVSVLAYSAKLPQQTELIVPFFKTVAIPLGTLGFIILGYFVVVGTSNAVNLTDGLDGLAIMPTVMIASALAVFAYVSGHAVFARYLGFPLISGAAELAVMCGAISGAGLAFLWFNAYPAEVFMGDVGALALGAALGMVALVVRQEIVLLIMAGVFVVETLSVIIQVASFKLTGKRVFRMAPLHHHYELKGWKENQVVVRFWIITMMLVLFGLSTLKLR